METLSLACVVLAWMLPPPSSRAFGMDVPVQHSNVQIPLLWGPCYNPDVTNGGVAVVLYGGLCTRVGQQGCAHKVHWKNKMKLCHLSSLICERLAQGNAGWPAAVKFMFLTVKNGKREWVLVSSDVSELSHPVVSRYHAQRKWHAQRVPKKPHHC